MIKLKRSVWLYLILLFIATYSVQIYVVIQGGKTYESFSLLIGITMFFPAIGAVIYLLKSKKKLNYINWRLGKPIYLFISLIIPILMTIIGVLIIEKIGIGTNNAYHLKGNIVSQIEVPLIFGSEQQSFLFFIFNFFITGIVFSLVTGLLTIGEEIGWRGFLQKKLLEQNSVFKSLTFLGVIWGFWHFPLIINGFNYPQHPVWGAFLIFPLMTVFISYFLGFLTIRSKSIWPAVLTHGCINSIMIILFEVDFGAYNLHGNFLILVFWLITGFTSYKLIKRKNFMITKEKLL